MSPTAFDFWPPLRCIQTIKESCPEAERLRRKRARRCRCPIAPRPADSTVTATMRKRHASTAPGLSDTSLGASRAIQLSITLIRLLPTQAILRPEIALYSTPWARVGPPIHARAVARQSQESRPPVRCKWISVCAFAVATTTAASSAHRDRKRRPESPRFGLIVLIRRFQSEAFMPAIDQQFANHPDGRRG